MSKIVPHKLQPDVAMVLHQQLSPHLEEVASRLDSALCHIDDPNMRKTIDEVVGAYVAHALEVGFSVGLQTMAHPVEFFHDSG